jgi:hypothetical protein
MSLIKKSDVKNHLSSRHNNHIHIAPASQPDATGFSGTNQAPIEANGSVFAQDFIADHTTSGAIVTPADEFAGSLKPQAPAAFGARKV